MSSSDSDGYYGLGSVINVSVALSGDVNVSGAPYLVLETGDTDSNASYVNGSGSNVLNFSYVVGENDYSPDLNYVSKESFKLNGSVINDSDNLSAVLKLPDVSSSDSLGGSKAIAVDGVRPVISVSGFTGTGTKTVSASDDDSGTTVMKHKIQTGSSCSASVPDDASSYTESDNVSLDQESYNGKYVCFWSTDAAGNVGKARSAQISGVDKTAPSVTVSSITGAGSRNVSATDDDSGTTVMKYKIPVRKLLFRVCSG